MVLEEADRPLVLSEVPVPVPGRGEVLLSVRACGLGLTIVWSKHDRDLRRPIRFPRIPGHEIAGDVIEVGEEVRTFSVGDRVVVYYYLTCGVCRMCLEGRENVCENWEGSIGRQMDGGLAEFVAVPERNLLRLPDEVSYIDGAVATDAVATPLHVLRTRAQLQPGETVVVVGGGGGVGLHIVMLARAMGAQPVCVDQGTDKLKVALDNGAAFAIDGRDHPEWHDAVYDYTAGRGADVVTDLVMTSDTVGSGFDSLNASGRYVMVGSYAPDTPLGLTARSLSLEQTLLRSRYCKRSEVSEALELVASGIVKTVVPTVGELEDAEDILEAIEAQALVGRAAITVS